MNAPEHKRPPSSSSFDLDRVGVVAIGRNEGERLRRCLNSLFRSAEERGRGTLPVVYVDSDSTDDSVAMARSLGAEVVELDTSLKFTAARARNAGFRRLLAIQPDVGMVQFIDGDCELNREWLSLAHEFLREHLDFGVVCGRRRERRPNDSIFNRLCDLEWDTPVGEATACGGDSMMRVQALLDADGFREDLIAGEEPELCFRLRKLGYRVMRVDAEMTLHDAAMTHPRQWLKRTKRSGHAFAEMAALHGTDAERPGVRQTLSNLTWGLGLPVGIAAAAAVSPGLAAVGGISAYSYLFYKSYRHERRQRSRPRSEDEARLFAGACVLGKTPEALGATTYALNRVRNKPSTLLEYKSPQPKKS